MKNHIPNIKRWFLGNDCWSSKYVIEENTHSRRDDIITLIYSLVYLSNEYVNILEVSERVKFFSDSTPKKFCSNGAEQLAPLLEEAYKTKFEEKPRYYKLK